MNVNNEDWEILSAYLSGDLTAVERAAFESWRNESEANRLFYKEAEVIWQNSNIKLSLHNRDTEVELSRLLKQIDTANKVLDNARRFSWNGPWLKIAASVILVVAAGYFYLAKNQSTESITSSGHQVATVYLPDSSKVWLNLNSAISYSEDFNGATREVWLEGEGYFRVKPDSSRPFKVNTSSTTTMVLGTSFNLKEDNRLTTLTVSEGRVQFFPGSDEGTNSVVVMPREQASFNGETEQVLKTKNNNPRFASWRKRNNPVYEKEKHNSSSYLSNQYTWKKNPINQSVIDGIIRNRASLATYKNIVLKVTYSQPGNVPKVTTLTIMKSVGPGEVLDYKRRLLDIFTETTSLKISIESAEISADDEP